MSLTFIVLSQTIRFVLALNIISESRTRVVPFQPKIIAKMCYLKPDTGPCRADIAMHYFSPETGDCPRFSWGGCQGNGNRFDTKQECISTCLSQPDRRDLRPPYCSLTFDYGYCFGAVPRWYFDPRWKVCKQTIYSGCGGNKNNFYSLAQCDSICRFGNGRLKDKKETAGGQNKVLIINPKGATRARLLPVSNKQMQ